MAMLEAGSLAKLQGELEGCMAKEQEVLSKLRALVRPLKASTRRIHPHSTTAISLVGTDGGNNYIQFDPFFIQLIRVVDSNENEYCLEVVTPRTDTGKLSARHFAEDGTPASSMGRMLVQLGIRELSDLSSMIQPPSREQSPSWVNVYRELTEWAILLDLVRTRDFASDTVIIWDGLLRTKKFKGDLFRLFRKELEDALAAQYEKSRRRIYIAGVAKYSKVLQTYRLAMALEGIMRTSYPCYVEVPRELETEVYKWDEWARGDDAASSGGEANKFVAGKMFIVKFGGRPHDPVWAVDLLESQVSVAPTIFGYMLHDAIEGFPTPFYPRCLQKAHEHAALIGFDMDILQDEIVCALRELLGSKGSVIDELALQDADPAGRRYE